MAQPFDADRLELTGAPVPVADDVPAAGPPLYSASTTGVLVHGTGTSAGSKNQLLWYDRQGKQLGQIGPPGNYNDIQLSPDGKKVVADIRDQQGGGLFHVWTADVDRGVFSRLNPGDAAEMAPAVSPDGRVAFSFSSGGFVGDIYASLLNGVGAPEPWVKSEIVKHPNHFSLDGRFLIYDVHEAARRQDLWVLPLAGDRKPIPVVGCRRSRGSCQCGSSGTW